MLNSNILGFYEEIIWLRLAQLKINEYYTKNMFKVPIHLALGHECIAVAVNSILNHSDDLILTHRNIHYNLIASKNLSEEINEFLLNPKGLAKGKLGSMNLSNTEKNIIYSSSILGNNLPVGCGVALEKKINNKQGISIIITGDGAIEEGTFYESLLMASSLNLPVLFIIENNEWSLGTSINERRIDFSLDKLCSSFDIGFKKLSGNDFSNYLENLNFLKQNIVNNSRPYVLEVKLKTLGSWLKKENSNPSGRFINYHAGPIKNISFDFLPLIENSSNDPIHVVKKKISKKDFLKIIENQNEKIERDLSDVC